jgi:Cu-processing system permease protein
MSRAARPQPGVASLAVLARWDARAILRDRWFISIAGAFAALTVAAALVALAGVDVIGVSAFGRVAATLVHLGMLFIPLLGLTAGALWIAGERETGSLAMVLSQPVDRATVYAGKFLGVAWGMIGAVAVGLGSAGVLLALRAGTDRILGYLWLVVLSLLLALATLAVGFAISAAAPGRSRALGTALVVWLGLVIVSDLGILGTALALRLPAPAVLVLGSLNPVSAFRLAAVVGISGSAEVTGPVGIYAADRLGMGGMNALMIGILVAWALGAFLAGRARFLKTVQA